MSNKSRIFTTLELAMLKIFPSSSYRPFSVYKDLIKGQGSNDFHFNEQGGLLLKIEVNSKE